MADLAVAHLAIGKPDGAPAGRQLGVRVALPERVKDRRLRLLNRVAGPRRRRAPAVKDYKAGSSGRVAQVATAPTIAANDSGSSEAPPTSAPSTSGKASSSLALSALTEPP